MVAEYFFVGAVGEGSADMGERTVRREGFGLDM